MRCVNSSPPAPAPCGAYGDFSLKVPRFALVTSRPQGELGEGFARDFSIRVVLTRKNSGPNTAQQTQVEPQSPGDTFEPLVILLFQFQKGVSDPPQESYGDMCSSSKGRSPG